jgi:hypothetical protein
MMLILRHKVHTVMGLVVMCRRSICRRRVLLRFLFFTLLICFSAKQRVHGLALGGGNDDHHLPSIGIGGALLKSSPAVADIQEKDVARRIRKQRSNRGRPRQLPPEETEATQSTVKRQQQESPKTLSEIAKGPARKAPQRNPSRTICAIDLSYESAIAALSVYHEDHSHLIMPRKFVVEDQASYPKEWHGIDLSRTVYDMKWWLRHVQQRPDRVAELNALGFVWERLQPEWNLILEALITYRTLHDDLLVPSKFVVPFGDTEWSRATWGISLGKSVYRIRSRGDFLKGHQGVKRRRRLDAIGFVWDVQEHLFDIFCSALRIYAMNEENDHASRRTGALKVPSQFVVPETKEWPRHLWGYPLGVKCTAVRQKELYVKGSPERPKVLAELGFHAGGNDSLSWLEVVHAAAVYSQMHNRNLDVPQSFVVPAPPRKISSKSKNSSNGTCVVGSDDAWPWPEYLWDFPLGQRLRDIRVKGYYLRGECSSTRRRQLDALGFNWNPKLGRPKLGRPKLGRPKLGRPKREH